MLGWLRGVALTIPVGLTVFDYVGVAGVKGPSMQPALNPDMRAAQRDAVLYETVTPQLNKYRRGEIIMCRCPDEPEITLIKRLVAIEGDEFETADGVIMIPPGHAWIEGDNKRASYDSRNFGPMPLAMIYGRPVAVVWPPWRAHVLTRASRDARLDKINNHSRYVQPEESLMAVFSGS